MILCR